MPDIMTVKSGSHWVATGPTSLFLPLTNDFSVDVAIVGGGIVGLTAATLQLIPELIAMAHVLVTTVESYKGLRLSH